MRLKFAERTGRTRSILIELRANPKHQHSIRLNTKQLTELGGIAAKAILTQEWGWDLCNNLAIEASRLQRQNIAFGGGIVEVKEGK